DHLDGAATRWDHLHVQVAGVPVPQGLADVETVHDAGCELFAAGQVGPDERAGLVRDVPLEALDAVVLRRPRALPERVPALGPLLALLGRGLGPQLARAPLQSVPRQTRHHVRHARARDVGLTDAHPQRWVVLVAGRLGEGILAGGLGDGEGEVIAGGLL